MKKKIDEYITQHSLNIKEVRVQQFLGSDIYYEKKDDGWHILLYPRVFDTKLGDIYVLISLAKIKRKETDDTSDLSDQIKSYSKGDELVCNELEGIFQALNLGKALNELLFNEYISLDDLRYFSMYLSNHFVTLTVATQFLVSLAALRNNGGQISIFHDELIKKKRYEMLEVIDIAEDSINKNILLENLLAIFNLLLKGKTDIDGLIKDIEYARDKAFGARNESNLDYHIAISFAGEDRNIASKIASELRTNNIKIFYDEYEKSNLWGKDLYSHLTDVYSKRALYCLMIISKFYKEKQWTNLERKAAQSRAFIENEEYILPLRLANTEIPGLLPTTGYIDFYNSDFSEIINLLKEKVTIKNVR